MIRLTDKRFFAFKLLPIKKNGDVDDDDDDDDNVQFAYKSIAITFTLINEA